MVGSGRSRMNDHSSCQNVSHRPTKISRASIPIPAPNSTKRRSTDAFGIPPTDCAITDGPRAKTAPRP